MQLPSIRSILQRPQRTETKQEKDIVPLRYQISEAPNETSIFNFVEYSKRNNLASIAGIPMLENPAGLQSLRVLNREKFAEISNLRPNIKFATFPPKALQHLTNIEEPVVITDLQSLQYAIESLPPERRAALTPFLLNSFYNNVMISELKASDGNVTLYRSSSDTDYEYGGNLQPGTYEQFEGYDRTSPLSWWRVPIEGRPYNKNQWAFKDRSLYIEDIDTLCEKGLMVADVMDPDSVVFCQTEF